MHGTLQAMMVWAFDISGSLLRTANRTRCPATVRNGTWLWRAPAGDDQEKQDSNGSSPRSARAQQAAPLRRPDRPKLRADSAPPPLPPAQKQRNRNTAANNGPPSLCRNAERLQHKPCVQPPYKRVQRSIRCVPTDRVGEASGTPTHTQGDELPDNAPICAAADRGANRCGAEWCKAFPSGKSDS